MKIIQGKYAGKKLRFGIVISRFNELITGKLLEGAKDCLIRHEVEDKDITLVYVPGAFEIPFITGKLAAQKHYDAIICLGAIIRGATPHFDYVASEASKGIAQISLSSGKPVIFGILTCDTIEQALERAGTKAGNKGWDAALNALEMVDLIKNIETNE